MLNRLKTFSQRINRLNQILGEISAWLILVMVVVTFLVVVLRYVFGIGWVWMQEIVIYSNGFAFLMAAAVTYARNGHVRVDIFFRKMSPERQAWVNLLGNLLLLLPFLGVLTYVSVPYVASSWSVFEGSKDGGGLEVVFIQKSFILLFCISLALQSLSSLFESLVFLSEGKKR